MKKWIITTAVILIFFAWQTLSIVFAVQDDKQGELDSYSEYVEHETGHKIISHERYHADHLYYVFLTHDRNNEEHYVLVNDLKEIIQISMKDIKFNKDDAREKAANDYPELQNILRIHPGIQNIQLVWEIIALDQEERLQYIYYALKDGQFIKRYKLTNE